VDMRTNAVDMPDFRHPPAASAGDYLRRSIIVSWVPVMQRGGKEAGMSPEVKMSTLSNDVQLDRRPSDIPLLAMCLLVIGVSPVVKPLLTRAA
jgi:hypothetical protein